MHTDHSHMNWARTIPLALLLAFICFYALPVSKPRYQVSFLQDNTKSNLIGNLQFKHVLHRKRGRLGQVGVFNKISGKAGSSIVEFSEATELVFQNQIVYRSALNTTSQVYQRWRAILDNRKKLGASQIYAESPDTYTSSPISIPDVSDKDTILSLASMASNAYVPTPHEGDWINVTTSSFSTTDSTKWEHIGNGFGWDDDGLRGYLFVNDDGSHVVISLKGTSAAVFDNGGPTGPKDKFNDNLFFSCCCARISYLWNTVCDCYRGKNAGVDQCDEVCLEEALWDRDHYYKAALDLYETTRALYPDATIWLTGHSLGGAISSMLGRTFGLPTVAFESPGEKLAAQRLHLPQPPGQPVWSDHVWHFGHTADPIYTGDCNGASSACWISGYAMETRCHTGLQCVYDSVHDMGWRSSIVNHRIHVVIDEIIKHYNYTPICVTPSSDCDECSKWNYIDPGISAASSPATSQPALPSKSKTR